MNKLGYGSNTSIPLRKSQAKSGSLSPQTREKFESLFSSNAGDDATVELTPMKPASGMGAALGILFFILAVFGLLVLFWYSGSSGASLDSSFGNHCAVVAGGEGSSAEGRGCASSFDSSHVLTDTGKCASTRLKEGFQTRSDCLNRRMGNRSDGFGPAGAGNSIQAQAAIEAKRSQAKGVSYYSPRQTNSPRNKPNYAAFNNKSSQSSEKFSNLISANKKDRIANMNNINNASTNIRSQLNGRRDGFMSTAQSKVGVGAEEYIASAGMINDFLGCDPQNPDYPSQYQPQQSAQELANSTFNLAQSQKITTSPLYPLVNGAVEGFSPKKGSKEGFSRRSAISQGNYSIASNNIQQGFNFGQEVGVNAGTMKNGDKAMLNSLAHGVNQTGKAGAFNVRQGSAYTSPVNGSGGAGLSQWGRYNNNNCNEQPTPFGKAQLYSPKPAAVATEGFNAKNSNSKKKKL